MEFLFLNLANVLYVLSYLVTDILWLRALAVMGGLSSLTWTLVTPTPNPTLIFWTVVYNVINIVQIGRLWHERRPVTLSPDERTLYTMAFRTLTPREFKRLIAVGHWQDAPAKEVLIQQGTSPGKMLVLVSGRAAVKVNGREVATLKVGQFAGEMSYLTGARTTAAVEVLDPVRFVWWPTEALEQFLRKHGELRSALQFAIGKDLAAKVVGDRHEENP
jgi:hypothetical protein